MIKATPARATFKRHLGQANHYLVTSLVALHTLERSSVDSAPEELRTSWNPKDRHASIRRTKTFVAQSALGWAVDAVDVYLTLLNRKPKLLSDATLVQKMDGAGRSVFKKADAVGKFYNVSAPTRAMVNVLITWRNNVLHELAENRVDAESRSALLANAATIELEYRHLEVQGLADKADSGATLTFKETTSLIHAAHQFVEEVDAAILQTFDKTNYCVEAIAQALKDRKTSPKFATKFFGLQGPDQRRFVANWIRNSLGFADLEDEVLDACIASGGARAG